MGLQWPAEGSGALNKTVLAYILLKEVHYLHHSYDVWPEVKLQRGNTAPPSEKIGLKIYWVWPHPPEQDPDSSTASPSHQEVPQASYPYPSEGKQHGNSSYRKLTKLITWIIALSKSVKLRGMPCRAIQGGWITVESPDKTLSIGEEKGKPLQHFCLENPMNSIKGKRYDTEIWTPWVCRCLICNWRRVEN